MSSARKVALWAGGAVVVVAIAVATTILLVRPGSWNGTMLSVSYRQSQAVPGFDDSTHTTTDPGRLAELRRVLHDDGWLPGDTGRGANDGCTGGITTHLRMTLGDGTTSELVTYRCGNDADALTADVTRLVSSWRSAG